FRRCARKKSKTRVIRERRASADGKGRARMRLAAKRLNDPRMEWVLIMSKLLLCWRYLLTRYLALACIISVMLGVATLIVVNSVMSGFSTKLRERLHALLSDVVVESFSFDGFT